MEKKFLGLRTAIYKVKDLQEGKQWYRTILGIDPYFDETFYVGFNVGGFELGLIPDDDNTRDGTGGAIAYWGVDDVQKTFDSLISAGATAHERPHDVGGNIVVAAVKDPWGNPFGLIFNPSFTIE